MLIWEILNLLFLSCVRYRPAALNKRVFHGGMVCYQDKERAWSKIVPFLVYKQRKSKVEGKIVSLAEGTEVFLVYYRQFNFRLKWSRCRHFSFFLTFHTTIIDNNKIADKVWSIQFWLFLLQFINFLNNNFCCSQLLILWWMVNCFFLLPKLY